MRKTSYFVTFSLVTGILILNILSARRPDWLVVRYEEVFHTKVTVTYGLTQRCTLTVTEIPGPSNEGKISYRKYDCEDFPGRGTDHCDKENKAFCIAWTSAGYIDQIALGFAALSLVTILFGVSTHSRRRRIWTAVAGLVLFQAACQIATFGIITDLYGRNAYPSFERARPGVAYILHTLTWIFSVMVATGVALTGMSAQAGHRWAAGNRAYHPIQP
ncbi:hypothetical protein GALMADRAFT_226564 [Galerina marginata CBS 339.88]|uniref:Uncharacterized protein n=1 Tax=Galerina marginata (strain CBS 339.88) TaxID=685588 RepID=A0A067T7L6_GALM3|nr:hypothetical protein GALMADRAFT_226564 [Galerina marginata CBS 339.88]